MKYKIGDKVRIKDHIEYPYGYSCSGLISEMKDYIGKIATITEVFSNFYLFSNFYHIDLDEGRWNWAEDMFEPVEDYTTSTIVSTIRPDTILTTKSMREAINRAMDIPESEVKHMKFKKGDRVRITIDDEEVKEGEEGVFVEYCDNKNIVVVDFDSGHRPGSNSVFIWDIELVKKHKGGVIKHMKLLAQKLLDNDLKTLIQAGVLTDNLQVSDHDFVLGFIVDKYKAELAKDAKKMLDEQKKK